MSGIDSKGEGVQVDNSGSLNVLSRIDGTVGIAAHGLLGVMKMVFSRRMLPNGRHSGHYCHVIHCPDLTLVQTVADRDK